MKNLSFILVALIVFSGCGAELRTHPPIVGPVYVQQTMIAKINSENMEFGTVYAAGRKTTEYDLMILGQKFSGGNMEGVKLAVKTLGNSTEYTIGDTALEAGFFFTDSNNKTKRYTGINGKLIFTSRSASLADGIFDFVAVHNDGQGSDTLFVTDGKFKVEIIQ